MTTSKVTLNNELKQFQKLTNLMKKTPDWDKSPKCAGFIENLSTDTSKEAQDVRDIMWRMVGVELENIKKLKQDS